MPSLGSILSVASSALRAQHEAINVTAHNIANASTEGYSRQRAVISALPPLKTAMGVFGTGVAVDSVQRIRDNYLDTSYRNEFAEYSEQDTRASILGQVETLLAEPGDGGLSNALDEFFSAWSFLATNPTSNTGRSEVRGQAESLTDLMNGLAKDMDQLRQDTEARLLAGVERINDLSTQIARLNREVTVVEAGGASSGDLRDDRDRAIDELAGLLPVQVTERENGSVGVLVSGLSLVDAANSGTLEVRNNAGTLGIALVGQPDVLPELGGAVGGMVELLNTDFPAARTALDVLAEALVTDLNTLHQTGTNPNGTTGVDFFDPAGTDASSIRLSAAVEGDFKNISAGTGDALGAFRAGANDLALSMASLRDEVGGTLSTSYGEHFRILSTDIGFSVRSSLDLVEVHETLAGQADVRRNAFSGVSTDEELVKLIEYQTAYAAAARVVSAADEILKTLVSV